MESKTVAILGGGVAGMSAAHELAERGFDVKVYEKLEKYVGGKARSVDVDCPPRTGIKNPLPGEHGFRFFPGFYKHVTHTMKRTPKSSENGVYSKETCFDNLKDSPYIMITKYKDQPGEGSDGPIVFPTNFFGSIKNILQLLNLVKNRDKYFGLDPGEYSKFAKKMLQLSCSSTERRDDEYEKLSWWEYVDADNSSKAYQQLLAIGVTRTLVAADAKKASTRTDGNIILQLLYDFVDPTVRADRLFNSPTNEAWLDPWKSYLESKGVEFHERSSVTRLELDEDKGTINGAVIHKTPAKAITESDSSSPDKVTSKAESIKADYYILAVPADRAVNIFNRSYNLKDGVRNKTSIYDLDPFLKNIEALVEDMSWMSGMQFYLSDKVQINDGHVNYAYSEWALTSIDQISFWDDYNIEERTDGKVKSILSVDISNWLEEIDNVEIAANLDSNQIKEEVWRQLKESLNREGQTDILTDDMLVYAHLDSDIVMHDFKHTDLYDRVVDYKSYHEKLKQDDDKTKDDNRERMLVNTTFSWRYRPDAVTMIPNLFLASDYVKTNTDLATMEAANEAARRAVNGILEESGSSEEPCEIWQLREPWFYLPLKWNDKRRYLKNLPFSFSLPFWMYPVMVVWGLTYLVFMLSKSLLFKLFGINPK